MDSKNTNNSKLKGRSKIIQDNPVLPTKYGYEQFVVLPIKIVNGCVSTRRN